MKLTKWFVVVGLCLSLLGCGHGFEGEYSAKSPSLDIVNGFANALGVSNVVGSQKIVIGPDYVETEGKRENYSKIFVRESGSEKYLIFKSAENEEAWKIVDDNTLVTGENTIASVTLKRIESKK